MELVKAIQVALDGQAMLFAGAGFTIGALNINGTKFKSGRQLAKMLSTASGVDETTDLDEAADIYIEKHNKSDLINLLMKEYTVKEPKFYHNTISSVNWMRIYTTNYDNILETCYANNGKKLTPVTLSDNLRALNSSMALCIHLNGFIDRLNSDTIMDEFKLTNTSYLTTSFLNSPWIARFRSDIKLARAIFFVGYSLYDLDIKRILFESEHLKDKCFFINQENPNDTLKYRISKFGSLSSIGVEGFAKEITNVRKNYIPAENVEMAYISFEKTEPAPSSSRSTLDDAIFKIFLYGNLDMYHLWASLQEPAKHPYFLYRQVIDDFFKSIETGRKNILFHSELGNGKSMLVEAIAYKALEQGIQTYILRLNRDNVIEEVDSILKQKSKTIIVIENYYNYFPILDYIHLNRNDNHILLLTARTSVNDVFFDRLDASLGHVELSEFDLNKLTQTEIDALIRIMDQYGLWQAMAEYSQDRKKRFIDIDCKGEFQGVLVSILESPDIQKRFADIITALSNKKDYYKVIIVVLVLDVLSINPTAETVMELLGTSVMNTSSFRNNSIVKQILDISHDRAIVRSSVLARFLLTTLQDTDILLDTLIEIARNAETFKDKALYETIFRVLTVYSTLASIFPEKGRRQNIIKFFEQVKNLEQTRRNPYFWLQYAIARLFFKDYEKAGTYFETAYALGKSWGHFNAYQIDNHYSRFLLERAIEENDITRCMTDYREAHAIISRQIVKEENRHYPYRVAIKYFDFYNQFYEKLEVVDQKFILNSCKYIVDRIATLQPKRQANRYVIECQEKLNSILIKHHFNSKVSGRV